MRVLVLNCGSATVKVAVVETGDGTRVLARTFEGAVDGGVASVVDLLDAQPDLHASIRAVGHRVVHGGERFAQPVILDPSVEARIEALSELAPLHNPPGLLGIRVLRTALPDVPHVAVFDTAFHWTLPTRAHLYAVPRSLYRDHGVRRYGFHGISHRCAAAEAVRRLGLDPAHHALVTAHLGNGCSATAVLDGRSIDTTMGLTPLEGLVMGTRSGDVDPGLHEHLARRLGIDVAAVTDLLNRQSGLLGVSGLSSDVRDLVAAADRGHEEAALAIDLFCYRLAKHVAALVVPLGRLDALVFTGGIGENAAEIRARTIAWLAHLGLGVDPGRNARHGAESQGVISEGGPPYAIVVPTDEERAIAEETAAVVERGAARAERRGRPDQPPGEAAPSGEGTPRSSQRR